MKKMLVLVLALLAMMMTAACAEGEFEFDLTESNTYGVIAYHGPGGHVVIPAEYEGRPVNYIGSEVFADNHGITSVIIPEGVDYIHYRAFYGCDALGSVQLPASMRDIGEQAFANCSALTEINLHNDIEWIGKEAFEGCDQLVLDEQEQAIYENNGAVKTVSGERIELGGYLGGSLQELMNLCGGMEMTPESWCAYEGAVYMNRTVLAYTLDDEIVAGVGVIGVSNYSVKGIRCDMTMDEVHKILTAQGYSVTNGNDHYQEYGNGNDEERIQISCYEGEITRIDLGRTA